MAAEARRRREVALAGHTGDAVTARRSLQDPAPLVRQSALVAVARTGSITLQDLKAALRDPDPGVRRRACEVAARLGQSCAPATSVEWTTLWPAAHSEELAAYIRRCLEDPSSQVCEMACYALGEAPGEDVTASVHALCGVAGGHAEPLCREAAIAALGAIGDPRGLPAVVAGLADKLGVRRRAAVALAAFDGPVAEAALKDAASSRDWQTRQIAEDLLADRGGDV